MQTHLCELVRLYPEIYDELAGKLEYDVGHTRADAERIALAWMPAATADYAAERRRENAENTIPRS
jgi:hypothetical protein